MEIYEFKGPNVYAACANCEKMKNLRDAILEYRGNHGQEVTWLWIFCQQRGWRGGRITASETGQTRIPVIEINHQVSYQHTEEGKTHGANSRGDAETVDCPHFYKGLVAPK